jgi:protocatechuate 3,4-dioxygenase beta subunit
VALIGALGVAGAPIAPAPKVIQGRVLTTDGKPVGHAVVRVLPESIPASRGMAPPRRVETAEDGSFLLQDLAGSAFSLRISAKGLAPMTRTHVAPGAPIEIKLDKGLPLAGIVREATTRQPVAGAIVRAWDAQAIPFGEDAASAATSGADGRFVVADLPPGSVEVEAKAVAHLPASAAAVALPRTGAPLELLVDPRAALTVRLVGPGGKPVAGLSAEFRVEAGASPSIPAGRDQVVAGEGGRFTIRGIAPGNTTVRMTPAGADDIVREHVKLERGVVTDLGTIEVREGAGISGRVTDSTKAPVAGAQVIVAWKDQARAKTKQVRTDKDGRYAIPAARALPVDLVVVRGGGFATFRRRGKIPVDGIVDAVLDRPGSIVGSVAASARGTLPTFRVAVHPELADSEDPDALPEGDRPSPRVAIDPSGSFRVDDLDPGTYTVEIAADGGGRAAKPGVEVTAEQVADAGTLTLEAAGALRGYVRDARIQSPVGGAAIRLLALAASGTEIDPAVPEIGRAVSSEDGSFAVEGARAGSFLVIVEHPVFAPSRVSVSLRTDQDWPDVIINLIRGGSLAGIVLDPQRQPAVDVRISVLGGAGGDARTAAAGPDGHYFIENLTPGTYEVVRQPGADAAGPTRKMAEIRAEETTTVDFDGTSRITVRGHVLKGDTPLPNTSIVLLALDPASPGEMKSLRADAQGAYEIGLDHAGAYQASVGTAATGRAPAGRSTVRIVVADQPEVEQDIVLQANSISGRVIDAGGMGIKGATVAGTRDSAGAGDASRSATAPSGADGSYRLDAVDAGTYRVLARAIGYRAADAYPVVVSEDTPNPTADLTLERGWILKGRVVDPQGRALAGAMVVIAVPGQAESGALSTNSDSSGAFRITAPADGPMSVTAFANGWAPAVLDDVPPPAGPDDAPVVVQATAGGALRIRVTDSRGQPLAGERLASRPEPLYPGSDTVAQRAPLPLTDGDGVALLTLLVPRSYVITIPGRRGVDPVMVTVVEGTEASASITVP